MKTIMHTINIEAKFTTVQELKSKFEDVISKIETGVRKERSNFLKFSLHSYEKEITYSSLSIREVTNGRLISEENGKQILIKNSEV